MDFKTKNTEKILKILMLQKKKFQNEKLVLVDKVKKLDEEWRKLKYDEDGLRSERNSILSLWFNKV